MTRPAAHRLFLALVLGLLAVGCADERAPINRVQPYALEKTYFVGKDLADPKDDPEFWAHTTVTDVGYGAGQDGLFTSTYAQPMSRIKWQITENYLIGRLAYERIQGSDGKGVGKAVNDGIVVAMFKIESHFDIKHSYNSTTGEELNVVEENSSDRPWFQRQYMHVDFSQNLNTDSYDFDTLSMMGIYGGIKYEPRAISINDPKDENAPFFSKDGSYFDVTSKAFATPGLVDLSHLGWGISTFPACFLDANFSGGTAPNGNCNPIELTLRHSFRRVVDTDYEPANWDGYRFQAYGAFTGERSGYARNYGMTDDKFYRMIERYNVWEQSHVYTHADGKTPAKFTDADAKPIECYTPTTTPFGADPHRDLDKDGTEDECVAAGKGSHCDTFRQRCTMPLQQRVAKPVVWYYTDGSQPEYFQGTEDAAHEWDVAMRAAVQSGKYAECMRVSTDAEKDQCATKYPMWTGQMEDNLDAIQLAKEVDDCRHGLAFPGKARSEAACVALADEIGGKRGLSEPIKAIAKMPEMVVLCHSPVEAGDPAVCASTDPAKKERLPANLSAKACFDARQAGDRAVLAVCNEAVHARRGDLRFHQINSIVEPQTPSPWGIMVDAHDPLTGEDISASVNVWTYINELWSQGVVDQARYIAGELKTSDVTEGTYIRDWSTAAKAASGDGALPKLSREQVDERMGDGAKRMDAQKAAQFEAKHPQAVELASQLQQQLAQVQAGDKATSAFGPTYLARRQAALGTEFEAALMTPMVQELSGLLGVAMTQGLLDMTSPLRGGNPAVQRDLKRMKEIALAERGACVMEAADAPLSIAGLGDELQVKFGKFSDKDSKDVQQARAEKMRRYLARRVQYAVIIHEMGHSMGLRHNFISSADPWGYRPQYWQLRTDDGAVTKACDTLAKDGTTCVGPRYFDPTTANENKNLIWMWQQSSVMDYAGETTQDLLGLGAYDFAAVKMFYGDTLAVHADPSYKATTKRGQGILAKVDNFGGILGLQYRSGTKAIHYSQLQKEFGLIQDCAAVDAANWKPGRWNEDKDGQWSPLLDGLIVSVKGQTTRCRQQPVDYVQWTALHEGDANLRTGVAVDDQGRTRVPYGFATDRWADLGNVSVYRHDNGADQYEIFNFMVTMQEVGHVFDNYRRGRKTFSVKAAANRTLSRFNEKMRDGAKGLALYRNIYRDLGLEVGVDPDDFWAYAARTNYPDSMLASGLVFDHFSRLAARPQEGPHYLDDTGVLRSFDSKQSNTAKPTAVVIPNGATGYFGNVAFGGRPVENRLADNQGEYDAEYTLNAGSYYDKMYTSMLLTESVDNFISSTLGDFTDARYRSCSLADLFPEGYRRFIGNALTGDDFLKGAHVATDGNGKVLTDADQFPSQAIGWTSWYGVQPMACFPGDGSTVCRSFGNLSDTKFGGKTPTEAIPVDSQIGWEQQKFLIAWTMLYLPENQQQGWMDMMRIWEMGTDADPALTSRIEFHNPTGKVYVARSYGKETIFGKTVEKGIAGRVLEYANELMHDAYETTDGPDNNGDGKPDWYLPVIDKATGVARVKFDEFIQSATGAPVDGCSASDNSKCTCTANRACMKLQQYVEVPFYLREAVHAYGLGQPKAKAIF